MVFKFNLKRFLISLAIPLGTGVISALITRGNMDIYSQINNPPFAPPGWLFPVVWTALYTLMGISLYLVWNSNTVYSDKKTAFILFGASINIVFFPISNLQFASSNLCNIGSICSGHTFISLTFPPVIAPATKYVPASILSGIIL